MTSLTFGSVLAVSVIVALHSGCDSQTPPITSSDGGRTASDAETEPVDFAEDVFPIFERSCFPCHGPGNSLLSMAGFRVDLQEHTVGRKKLIPEDPDESLLIKRLITDEDSERMPPLKSDNPQLSHEEIDLLKRWIMEGAIYDTGRRTKSR